MEHEVEEYLSSLEDDLRKKKDCSSELDDLFQLTFLGDVEVRQKASWCVAKMGQNKIQDMRILDILSPLANDADEQVRENVAWGIGEVAGAGIGDDRSVDAVMVLMKDSEKDVRGMAIWAAGRLIHKLGMGNEEMIALIGSMSDDPSDYIRKSVSFALNGE